MALINCPECNKEISDKAGSCPHCGYPISVNETINSIEEIKNSTLDTKSNNNIYKKVGIIAGIFLVGFLLLGFIIYPPYKAKDVAKDAVESYLGNPSTITFTEIEVLDVDTFYSIKGEYTYIDGLSMNGSFKVYVNKKDYNIDHIRVN